MVRIRRVDAALMDEAKSRDSKEELTPEQQERLHQQRQFASMMKKLDGPSDVFEVVLGKDDKAVTVRQRLLRAASDAGREVAVRKSPNGFLVGLMTPDRRSNRGRKKASTD